MSERLSVDEAANIASSIADQIGTAVITDETFIETILTGFLGQGHVLVEDVPGTGKTLTAVALADTLDLEFNRIQFTPDLLPSDITGSHVFNEQDGSFQFQKGPIFANVILADEINRASPKTQAALLEAMEEQQVTVDGDTYELPDPFFVIATQNPIEQEGTFRLPEAQRDRFIVKTSMGYPSREGELELIARRSNRTAKTPRVEAAVDAERVSQFRAVPDQVTMEQQVREYLVDIARETRDDERVKIGVSPRGIQRFFEAARAHAVIAGRDYVTPDDVKAVTRPVVAHRLILSSQARLNEIEPEAIISDVLDTIPVPGATGE